jgi:mitogen-activated protein kinase 1/3
MDNNLKNVITSDVALNEEHHLYIMYQILRGLKYIHSAGVVHRDLKPENILINVVKSEIRITDFGLARGVSSNSELTAYVCTRWYRAPEIMLCASNYDAKVDVWSVGCIWMELLTRRVLLPGVNYHHQVKLIFDTIGYTSALGYDWIASQEARNFVQQFNITEKKDLRKIGALDTICPESIFVINALLEINPVARFTVEEALATPFFHKLHGKRNERVMDPKYHSEAMKFEQLIANKNRHELREIMYQTLVDFSFEKLSGVNSTHNRDHIINHSNYTRKKIDK